MALPVVCVFEDDTAAFPYTLLATQQDIELGQKSRLPHREQPCASLDMKPAAFVHVEHDGPEVALAVAASIATRAMQAVRMWSAVITHYGLIYRSADYKIAAT